MASKCPPLQVAVVLEGRRAVLRGQLASKGLPGLFFWGSDAVAAVPERGLRSSLPCASLCARWEVRGGAAGLTSPGVPACCSVSLFPLSLQPSLRLFGGP